tara:strand:+ start:123 stop:407 length:285 start_codon:yes stop_codon:yes gene_type:complete
VKRTGSHFVFVCTNDFGRFHGEGELGRFVDSIPFFECPRFYYDDCARERVFVEFSYVKSVVVLLEMAAERKPKMTTAMVAITNTKPVTRRLLIF